jgi:DNA primase
MQRLWNAQGIGMSSQLPWRIFIPIELNGEMVSWTTRSINDYGLRYISAKLTQESFPHKHLLYGEDYARHTVIIHEGPLDVWTVGPGAVGTLGTSYTRAQVVRMSKYLRRVVCFDNEPEAQRRARKLCDDLEPFEGETHNVILDAKDANTASAKEIRRLRRLYLD